MTGGGLGEGGLESIVGVGGWGSRNLSGDRWVSILTGRGIDWERENKGKEKEIDKKK